MCSAIYTTQIAKLFTQNYGPTNIWEDTQANSLEEIWNTIFWAEQA